jgi:dTDP-4-amino-4,6-dideoxygalactose transaminase
MTLIPLVDLKAQHREIAAEFKRGLARVLQDAGFILGEEVRAFEEAFAAFSGVAYCVGVGSGTDALELIVRALGIRGGDEVIVPVNSFIATALAVARAGATPVLVDCDPVSHLIDTKQAVRRISERTKAIMPVHLYGQLAPMEELKTIAVTTGVMLVEDAADAHGALRNGKGAGNIGVAAGMSFYPDKNLGAYGDGGAVLTNSAVLADKVRMLRNYGGTVADEYPERGWNTRLDALQAVVLNAKLKHLAAWNAARQEAARRYDELLADEQSITRPVTARGNQHVWRLYVVRVPRRDDVLRHLNAAGIGAGVHYPTPIHLQGAFKHLGHKRGDFPVAEAAAGEILSLPLFPEITAEQQRRVAAELKKALRAE